MKTSNVSYKRILEIIVCRLDYLDDDDIVDLFNGNFATEKENISSVGNGNGQFVMMKDD